jgi:hypothetical protein
MPLSRFDQHLNDQNWNHVTRTYDETSPYNYAVLENFLTATTIAEVREYLINSKAWAFMNSDGPQRVLFLRNFNLPLVRELAAALSAELPALLGPLHLVEYSAFMNRNHDGLDIHSDNGIVTLNIYLTPDEFNLEPESGGMTLFDVKRREDQAVHEFNAQPWCTEYFRKHTKSDAARIAYRFNRAVLFDARTLHSAERMRFRCADAASHRLNMALRFDYLDDYNRRKALYRQE